MTAPISIQSIKLLRAEGPTDQCGKWHEFNNFIDANCKLKSWSYTAPKGRASDKCDFLIVWQDGQSYKGCFDLRHHEEEVADLSDHVRHYLQYVAGERCPAHFKSEEQYQASLRRFQDDVRAKATTLLAQYQLSW